MLPIRKPKFVCSICEERADGYHFGIVSCRACAAFFRRYIANKLKYVCRFEDNCEINKSKEIQKKFFLKT
jgi:hypothetical protein